MKRLLPLLALAGTAYLVVKWMEPPLMNSGTLLAGGPLQRFVPRLPFSYNGCWIFPLASYQLDGRVLSRQIYFDDNGESVVSPVDLAFGWGAMSRDELLEKLEITQSDRFFYWNPREKVDFDQVRRNAANVHIIPATPQLGKFLSSVTPGQYLALKGSLVSVTGEEGWRWMTSLTREDVGAGACEIFYVESAQEFRPTEGAPQLVSPVQAQPPAPPILATSTFKPKVGPAEAQTVTLREARQVELEHGALTIPANATMTVLEHRAGKTKGRYNGFTFWIPTEDIR